MAFRDRIVSFERVRAGDLVEHPRNWRGPDDPDQSQAVRDNLTEIGQVVPLCTYRRTDGKLGLVDGHLRRSLDPDAILWVGITDLTETEAEKELAALDQLAKLKPQDDVALAALLASIQQTSEDGLQGTGWDDEGLDALIAGIAAESNGTAPAGQAGDFDPSQVPDREFDENLDLTKIKHATCPECGHEFPL